jgi:uncharacterized coiled-coil protein SlyX
MPDAAASTVGWFPAFTALLGFVTSSILEWLRDRRASEREREAREAARRVQQFERRANFQRETLINLQDAVVKLSRTAGRMHHLATMEQRKTGKWGGHLFSEDLDDDAHHANVTIMVLTSRVRDDRIREMAETFRSHASKRGGLSDRRGGLRGIARDSWNAGTAP